MTTTIKVGHCLDVLREMPSESIHMVWTSIPYWGLRSYQTEPQAWGGDPACSHSWGDAIEGDQRRGQRGENSILAGRKINQAQTENRQASKGAFCDLCNAWRGEHGTEPTLDLWLKHEVMIFREVRRVLRSDGTLWLNCGDAYASSANGRPAAEVEGDNRTFRDKPMSTTMANTAYIFNRSIKSGIPVVRGATTIALSAKGQDILSMNDLTPYCKLTRLFGIQRVFLEDRDKNLTQILHLIDAPYCDIAALSMWSIKVNAADAHVVVDTLDDISIVITQRNLSAKPAFSVAATFSGHHNQTTLSVEQSGKPMPESRVGKGVFRNSVPRDPSAESLSNVDLVDTSIALGNASSRHTKRFGNFNIAKASPEQLDLFLAGGRISVRIDCVGHLLFEAPDGGFVTYSTVYDKAKQLRHRYSAKQRINMPCMLVEALANDGWIYRDQVIWQKPNSMPSSITDRTTPAHEMLYLLSKKAHYYYDCDAIREPFADGRMGMDYPRPNAPDKIKSPHGQGFTRRAQATPQSERNRGGRSDGFTKPNAIDPSGNGGRNKRSVWTIATEPFAEAHFATAPTKLVEPCVLAGTSQKGVCPACGAPWVRRTSKRFRQQEDAPNSAERPQEQAMSDNRWGGSQRGSVDVETIGWEPSCSCRYMPGGDSAPAPVPATILDPFGGAGTTALVAQNLGRNAVLIELNPEYAAMARTRLRRGLHRVKSDLAESDDNDLPLFGGDMEGESHG